MANAIPKGINEENIDKAISKLSLTGLSNNTKWNELIEYVRSLDGWKPSYRSKTIYGFVSEWDAEWYYHLPFPFKLVLWFDIGYNQMVAKGNLIENVKIDHSAELERVIMKIGFEYDKSTDFIRIYGYGPRDHAEFE